MPKQKARIPPYMGIPPIYKFPMIKRTKSIRVRLYNSMISGHFYFLLVGRNDSKCIVSLKNFSSSTLCNEIKPISEFKNSFLGLMHF